MFYLISSQYTITIVVCEKLYKSNIINITVGFTLIRQQSSSLWTNNPIAICVSRGRLPGSVDSFWRQVRDIAVYHPAVIINDPDEFHDSIFVSRLPLIGM